MKNGIYTDLSIQDYHENRTHNSSSAIKEAFKSLEHFNFYINKEQKKKLHFDFGNAFEIAIREDDLCRSEAFENAVAIFDEQERPSPDKTFGAKDNKLWKAVFFEDNKDKLILPATGDDSLEVLIKLVNSVKDNPIAMDMLIDTNHQESIFWTDENTGINLKTRPDFWKPSTDIRPAIIVDLKTDRESETDKHLKKIIQFNYPLQAVLQIEGLISAKLIDANNFRYFWLVASKSEPYNTGIYEFGSEDYLKLKDAFSFKLNEIKIAQDSGSYKSYEIDRASVIKTIEFPFWYKNKLGIK